MWGVEFEWGSREDVFASDFQSDTDRRTAREVERTGGERRVWGVDRGSMWGKGSEERGKGGRGLGECRGGSATAMPAYWRWNYGVREIWEGEVPVKAGEPTADANSLFHVHQQHWWYSGIK